jgi:hypothetical protein
LGGLFSLSIHADTFYVDATYGSNSYSGYSWSAAKKTIQAAMDLADGYDTICVAQGVYNEKVTFPTAHANQLLGGYPTGGGSRNPSANVTVIDGTGTGTSGAIVVVPGRDNGTGYDLIVIDGFTIRDGTDYINTAGGIYSRSLGLTIRNCIVENNYSDGRAGGIAVYAGEHDTHLGPFIEQTIVRNNTCSIGAGGLFFGGERQFQYQQSTVKNVLVVGNSNTRNSSIDPGIGAMNVQFPAWVAITNCTIADNTIDGSVATAVSGIFVGGQTYQKQGVANIHNSIIWHPTGDDIYIPLQTDWPYYPLGVVNISYSDVEDTSDTGTAVTHADPNFFGGSDYHLSTFLSPCCDSASPSGAPAIDLQGRPRPQAYGYDMGAYEFLYGDLNADKTVDIDDLNRVLTVWLADDPNVDMGPYGGDGIINFTDFSLLVGNWQKDVN